MRIPLIALAIDDGAFRPVDGFKHDLFTVERYIPVAVAGVNAIGYKYGIPGGDGIDPLLDSGVVCGDIGNGGYSMNI